MKQPESGKSRFALIAMAGEGRRLRFILLIATTAAAVAFNFLNPQIIRYTIDSVIGTAPLDVPGFVLRLIESLGGLALLRQNIWI